MPRVSVVKLPKHAQTKKRKYGLVLIQKNKKPFGISRHKTKESAIRALKKI